MQMSPLCSQRVTHTHTRYPRTTMATMGYMIRTTIITTVIITVTALPRSYVSPLQTQTLKSNRISTPEPLREPVTGTRSSVPGCAAWGVLSPLGKSSAAWGFWAIEVPVTTDARCLGASTQLSPKPVFYRQSSHFRPRCQGEPEV